VTVTVTSDQCCATRENTLRPKLDDLFDEHAAENVWFQQVGATAHVSCRLDGILREIFSWASCLLAWPPRLPDLTLCDFFSLGLPQSPGIPTSSPNFRRS
jgi:hypothetical protein